MPVTAGLAGVERGGGVVACGRSGLRIVNAEGACVWQSVYIDS